MKRTALVTGGSRGIGAAVARMLASEGYTVVIQYHEAAEAAEKVVKACREYGSDAFILRSDLRTASAIIKMKEELTDLNCQPDVIVHCAGIAHYGLLEELEENSWDNIMNIHLKAAYYMTKEFSPAMRWQRWGRFIHLSSIWGVIGAAGEAAYAASKGGLNAFTKSMAKELGSSSITVNAVAPGAIETDMLANLDRSERIALCSEIPMGRLGQPDEVAQLIRFLVSEDSSYITGQIIELNGGWHM